MLLVLVSLFLLNCNKLPLSSIQKSLKLQSEFTKKPAKHSTYRLTNQFEHKTAHKKIISDHKKVHLSFETVGQKLSARFEITD